MGIGTAAPLTGSIPMTFAMKSAALAAAIALSACQQQSSGNANAADNAMAAPANANAPLPEEPAADVKTTAPAPSGNDTASSEPAPPLTDSANRSETGARAVLLDFTRAIERKRFDQAYALLSPGDKQRWSRSEFGAIFEDLGRITVAAPTGTLEGAAGSSYYSAPLTITSSDKDGRPVRIEGEAVLRRVNDVDGATPARLRWHMDKLTLNWTH